jgi:hypothetical protein
MKGKTEVIRTRPKLGERRERPHPMTHRASRTSWGRSRLCHALRVTRLGRVHTQGQAVSNADSNTIGQKERGVISWQS